MQSEARKYPGQELTRNQCTRYLPAALNLSKGCEDKTGSHVD